MNKKAFILIVFISVTVVITAQVNRLHHSKIDDCERFPYLTDSVYIYNWDKTTSQWDLITIWKYENSEGRHDRLIYINAENRVPNRSWEYFYDANENRNYELSTIWRENQWLLHMKRESEFNEFNQKTHQLISNWKNGTWIFNSYYYNEYSGGKLIKVVYQSKDIDGIMYDQSFSLYSYENEKISKVTGYRSSDGAITSISKYLYDEKSSLTELLILIPDSDVQNSNNFVPSKRRLYYYDDYFFLREVLFQDWNGTDWEITSKYIYYYKFDNSQKVSICHNGHTICVSINAVKAHLAHGDLLGECTDEKAAEKQSWNEQERHQKPPFKIYPNPAREKITIKFDKDECKDLKRVELTDFYGKLVRSFNIKDNSDLTIYRNSLLSGKYYIRLSGKEVYSAVVIFD